MSSGNRTVFIISAGTLRDVPQLDTPIELEIKGYEQNIQVKQPFRTTILECVMDYCRVAYDILPRDAALSVVLEQKGDIKILNGWDWKEQNFNHVRFNLTFLTLKRLDKNSQKMLKLQMKMIRDQLAIMFYFKKYLITCFN